MMPRQMDLMNQFFATADGNMQTQATAAFTGRTEDSSMTIRFSDLVGSSADAAAQYGLRLQTVMAISWLTLEAAN